MTNFTSFEIVQLGVKVTCADKFFKSLQSTGLLINYNQFVVPVDALYNLDCDDKDDVFTTIKLVIDRAGLLNDFEHSLTEAGYIDETDCLSRA